MSVLMLKEIAEKYGSDKINHGFITVYEGIFEKLNLRERVKSVLEVGIHEGRSLMMWRDFFPNASVTGWDITSYEGGVFGDRTVTKVVDQSSIKSITDAVKGSTLFDVIIDDGSHRMYDQQITFSILWERLAPGGVYIIEDLHTSLPNNAAEWVGGGCLPDFSNSTLEMVKGIKEKGVIKSPHISDLVAQDILSEIDVCEVFDTKGEQRDITSIITKKDPEVKDKKVVGYLHVALMNDLQGLLVATEMHGRLIESGLYEKSDHINVFIAYEDEQQYLYFKENILVWYPKYVVRKAVPDLKSWEWLTLLDLKTDCESSTEEFYLWYMHTKGASNCRSGVPMRIQANIRNWRNTMFSGISDYTRAIRLLDSIYSTVGPFLSKGPDGLCFYRGNYWWASSTYIASIPPILKDTSENRNSAEGFIGFAGKAEAMGELVSNDAPFDLYDFDHNFAEGGPFKGLKGNLATEPLSFLGVKYPMEIVPDRKKVCLNIGCHDIHFKDFINIDIDPEMRPDLLADVTKLRDHFKDGTVDFIYAGHLLEHFSIDAGKGICRDVHSLLKDFSSVAAVVPDYSKIPEEYTIEQRERVILGAGEHLILMDVERLRSYFIEAGFDTVIETSVQELGYCPFPEVPWQSCVVAIKHPKVVFNG